MSVDPENPSGTLGFGLRHSYPIRNEIRHVYGLLQASDAVVYRSFRALGFQPALYMYVEWTPESKSLTEGGLLNHVNKFQDFGEEDDVDVTRDLYLKRVDTSFITMMSTGRNLGMRERR